MSELNQLFETRTMDISTALGIVAGKEAESYPFVSVQFDPALTYRLTTSENAEFALPLRPGQPENYGLLSRAILNNRSVINGFAGFCGAIATDPNTSFLLVTEQLEDLYSGSTIIPTDSIRSIKVLADKALLGVILDFQNNYLREYRIPILSIGDRVVLSRTPTTEEMTAAEQEAMAQAVSLAEIKYVRV